MQCAHLECDSVLKCDDGSELHHRHWMIQRFFQDVNSVGTALCKRDKQVPLSQVYIEHLYVAPGRTIGTSKRRYDLIHTCRRRRREVDVLRRTVNEVMGLDRI